MGMSVLHVINDDIVDTGTGFGNHGHKDIKIVSYVLEDARQHGQWLWLYMLEIYNG
jgi:redox-sensitive bicupin YhaK (pirin superfamily)